MIKNRTTQGYILNALVIAILLIGFSFIKESFGKAGDFKLIIAPSIWQCCYLIILATSLNMTLGFLGQLSLGHCGFMAVGAYSAALISLAAERAGVFDEKSGPAFILVLIGCILILLSTTAGGFLYGVEQQQYLEKLMYIRHILELIQGEIEYSGAPLFEVFGKTAKIL